MIVRIGGTAHRGRAIDLRDRAVDAEALHRAVVDRVGTIVETAPPGPIHRLLGPLRPGMTVDRRAALASAARSRGVESVHDAAVAAAEARLEAIDRAIAEDTTDRPAAEPLRRAAADAGADVARLRERAATIRGRIAADEEAGRTADGPRATLRETIAALSEAETEALAAEQALEAAQRDRRALRDERERRLSLADRRDNLRRRARRGLADRERGRLRRALRALPGPDPAGDDVDPDPFRLGLAVVRLARLRAPVVVADAPFPTATAARAALDAPVVLV